MLFLFSLLCRVGCGWLPRLSTAILRNAKDPGFGPTSGKADPTVQVSGLPPIITQPLCDCVQRPQSQKCTRCPQGCQYPSDCPVTYTSPPNKIPVSVWFGNLAMLWHSRFGDKGFQIVLGHGAFCDVCCGKTGHGYSLELLKTAERLWLWYPGLADVGDRAWVPQSCHLVSCIAGWGWVGTVHFFSGIL